MVQSVPPCLSNRRTSTPKFRRTMAANFLALRVLPILAGSANPAVTMGWTYRHRYGGVPGLLHEPLAQAAHYVSPFIRVESLTMRLEGGADSAGLLREPIETGAPPHRRYITTFKIHGRSWDSSGERE